MQAPRMDRVEHAPVRLLIAACRDSRELGEARRYVMLLLDISHHHRLTLQ